VGRDTGVCHFFYYTSFKTGRESHGLSAQGISSPYLFVVKPACIAAANKPIGTAGNKQDYHT
jgi:hypothetical protein